MHKNETVPKVPPLTKNEIESKARETLRKAFFDFQNARQPYAMIRFFDSGGLTKLGFEYDVQEMPYEQGRYEPKENCIVLSESTYKDLLHDIPRAKFTLAHELGHGVQHGSFLRKALTGKTTPCLYRRKQLPPFFDPEWQADMFAGAFLMPANIFRQLIKAGKSNAEMARYFGVSTQAILTRKAKI